MQTSEARLASWSRVDRELIEAQRRLQRARDASWAVEWDTHALEMEILALQHEKRRLMIAAVLETETPSVRTNAEASTVALPGLERD